MVRCHTWTIVRQLEEPWILPRDSTDLEPEGVMALGHLYISWL